MKTTSKSKQEREGEKRKVPVEGRNPQKMVGSGDAEVAVIEDTNQSKQTGRKRVKTRAEKDAHKARCVEYRKNKKLRFEELEKLETEVMPRLQIENQKMKMELEELISKTQCLENENKELKAFKEQVAKREQMTRQIPTSWKFDGQTISSLEHCQDLIFSQPHDQQVCQGFDYTSITASDAGTSVADFDFTSDFDDLVAGINFTSEFDDLVAGVNFTSEFDDLVAGNKAGIPNDPGAGSSSGAKYGEPVLDADDIDLLICDPDDDK